MTSLKGAVCVVTGGSDGFGVGIARKLKEHGAAKVIITGRDKTRLDKVAAEIGGVPIVADVTSPADWDRVFAAVGDRLNVLVNNAGAAIRIAPGADAADADVSACIAVNLTGAIYGSNRAAKLMSAQRSGTIINVSSVCDRHAWPGFSVYSAAKAGLRQYTRCLYTEMRPVGVRVTLLCPSWGRTGFSSACGLSGLAEDVLQRTIQPDEIGKVVVQLCELPAHLCIDDMVLRPLVQEIIPM